MLAAVRLRKLRTVRGGPLDNYIVTAETLAEAIEVNLMNYSPYVNKENLISIPI